MRADREEIENKRAERKKASAERKAPKKDTGDVPVEGGVGIKNCNKTKDPRTMDKYNARTREDY